jgi:hypothetical protein
MIDVITPGVSGGQAGASLRAAASRDGQAPARAVGRAEVPALAIGLRDEAALVDLGALHAQAVEARVSLLLTRHAAPRAQAIAAHSAFPVVLF